MNRAATLLIPVAGALLSACAAHQPADSSVASLAPPERFIVVTIRNEGTLLVARAGSTPRSYAPASSYAVAPTTLAHSRSIAAKYELREVAGWPIGLLDVHCLVFELAAGANREDIIQRLRRDARVESVQPLNTFETLSSDPYRGLQRNLGVMNEVTSDE